MRAAAALVILLAAASAHAYPQFQLSTGNVRCNQCHFAPAGGGLINNYGREEAGDTISRGGNGAFLHGLVPLPSWLALGGDVRLAGLVNEVGSDEGAETLFIPMQADLYVRFKVGDFALSLTGGFRGSARPRDPALASRVISREHYIIWQPRQTGPYVRAGRFFAPYGLRVPDHVAYIRRWLGFNTLEETYALSGGYISNPWEIHVAAFTADFIRPVGQRGSGGAVYYERRFGDAAAAGAQARVSFGPEDTWLQGGGLGKLYLEGPQLLLMAELDVREQIFSDADVSRAQLGGYLGVTSFPTRGLMVGATLERWDEDLAIEGVARDALSLSVQFFPYAHIELQAYGRFQLLGTGGDDGEPSALAFLMLHYYL